MSTPKRILAGFFYTLGSGYAARLGSVGLTILIKRQVDPQEAFFADVVLGVTVFALLSSLREFGLPHALLHFQDRVHEFAGTHFLLNVAISSLSAVVNSAVALAMLLLLPQLFPLTAAVVVWAFSGLQVVRNVTLTSESLLRMEFDFGRLSVFHGLASLLALGASLLAARAGWKAWSLILGGWSTYSVFSAVYVLLFSAAVWRSRPMERQSLRFDPAWARTLLRYGGWIWVGWIFQTFTLWYDKLVVGWAVGKTELALYENAWWLVQLPTALITHIIFTYTNTLYSRYRNDRERLSELYSRMMGLIVAVSSPLALVLLLNAREVVALMPGWADSAPILVGLAGYAFLRPLLDDGHGLLWAVGDTRGSAWAFGLQALAALVLVPCLAQARGVIGVAWSMGVVAAVGAVTLLMAVRRHASLQWREVFLGPLVGLGLATAVALLYNRWAVHAALADFLLRSGLVLLFYAAGVWMLQHRRAKEQFLQVRRILQDSRGREAS